VYYNSIYNFAPVERHKEIRSPALILTGKEQVTIAIYFNLKKVEAER
jgi:hypothetical protein